MGTGVIDHLAVPRAPAPRNVPGGPRFAGLRTIAALLCIAALVVVGVWTGHAWTRHQRGNPDPGGARLTLLRQAEAALIGPGSEFNEQLFRFKWIPANCSMPGKHAGWSDEQLTASVGAKDVPAEMQAAKAAMTAQGWRLVQETLRMTGPAQGASATWDKPVPGSTSGQRVRVAFTLQPVGWFIYASSPPAGRAQVGCP